MNTLLFMLYSIIFICIWYVFNQYFKDHSYETNQPVRINMNQYLNPWKEHFGNDKLSTPNIRNIVQTALRQLKTKDDTKPQIEQKTHFKNDMELYLIGPNKDTFYKNLRENRKKPTTMKTIKPRTIEDYFGSSTKNKHIELGQL